MKNKKILIYGLGRSGQSALKLALLNRYNVCAVNQGDISSWQKPEYRCDLYSEAQAVDSDLFSKVDIIVISPGIDPRQVFLKNAIESGSKIISEIEFAYQHLGTLKAPIVGITGTNGKTTTTTMLGKLAHFSGKTSFVGGNIGVPFCDYIISNNKVDYIFLELSSFQLESMIDFHVNVALLLNIFQNHGERYNCIGDYAEAKLNILNHMNCSDLFIYQNDVITHFKGKKILAKSLAFDPTNVKNDELLIDLDFTNFKLVGEHNYSNLYCCLKVAEYLGMKSSFFQILVDQITAVEFRLELIESNCSYTIYNDAKSTNWSATLSALHSIPSSSETAIIIGGQFRGHGDSIKEHIETFSKHKILLIGETSDFLADELDGKCDYHKCYTIESCKSYLDSTGFSGTLLFSPAYPSFDQFSNYVERGKAFTSLFS